MQFDLAEVLLYIFVITETVFGNFNYFDLKAVLVKTMLEIK